MKQSESGSSGKVLSERGAEENRLNRFRLTMAAPNGHGGCFVRMLPIFRQAAFTRTSAPTSSDGHPFTLASWLTAEDSFEDHGSAQNLQRIWFPEVDFLHRFAGFPDKTGRSQLFDQLCFG